MEKLEALYSEILLDHYRDPRHQGCPASGCDHYEDGFNPLCGDRIRLALKWNQDHTVLDKIYFDGQGCSISMASASMMMESVEGQTIEHCKELIEQVRSFLQGQGSEGISGDLKALQGVARFPVRIKCALLPWMTLKKSLEAL